MDYRKLALRLPRTRADSFEATMRAKGHRSAAGALRALIDAAMGVDPAATVASKPKAQGRRQRLWVNVTAEEGDRIRTLAAPFGGVTAWMRGIVDARLGRVQELPAREEIEALHQATVQLGRLATNINQIARALNTARLAGEPTDSEAVKLDELAQLRQATAAVSERANAVILAARRRVFNE